MLRIFVFLLVLIGIISCKDKLSDSATVLEANWEVSIDSLPTKISVSPKAGKILTEWKEYNALETSLDKIYTTENREDLDLVLEELIENQKKMAESEYPEVFNIPQIKGRQRVFKTYVLKTKGNLEYRQNPQESLTQMIGAFNELSNQFSVSVRKTFLEEIRLNEEN